MHLKLVRHSDLWSMAPCFGTSMEYISIRSSLILVQLVYHKSYHMIGD